MINFNFIYILGCTGLCCCTGFLSCKAGLRHFIVWKGGLLIAEHGLGRQAGFSSWWGLASKGTCVTFLDQGWNLCPLIWQVDFLNTGLSESLLNFLRRLFCIHFISFVASETDCPAIGTVMKLSNNLKWSFSDHCSHFNF